ncbi:MAG: hypothetical protein ACK48R_01855 [Planctomyces sp.]|jgi:hypothetical protein
MPRLSNCDATELVLRQWQELRGGHTGLIDRALQHPDAADDLAFTPRQFGMSFPELRREATCMGSSKLAAAGQRFPALDSS